ncbi:MAG TPA: FkbM family methyltransferase [Chthoniobacteraceae bacterium]|nr:FkbM family methyltransferase [Chthoniobacteraceae bacterium]
MKRYLRDLIEAFPHALIESIRHAGWRGAYVAFCAFVLRSVPIPVRLPDVGLVALWNEAANVVDNLFLEELRCGEVEREMAAAVEPVVVDLGVNVGITVRWWLALNASARVIGVDMLEEALAFAAQRLSAAEREHFSGVCAAAGECNATREVWFEAPLEGTSSLLSSHGRTRRTVEMRTLDSIMSGQDARSIFLLKIDIEGYAGHALECASETLRRCRYATVEDHGPDETSLAARHLHAAGFELAMFKGRQMWWRRATS